MGHATTKPGEPRYQCPDCGRQPASEWINGKPHCACGAQMRRVLKQIRLSRR